MTNSQLAFRGVRSSKYRHVYATPAKKDKCYDNIKITKSTHDSQFCAINPKFLAVVTEVAGGGTFLVLPLEKTGRIDFNASKITGHKGPVLDIKWNPFNDNVIASSSEDCTIKLWHIPDEGLTENVSDWLIDLHGHRKRVGYIEWHPTAENILVSAGYDYLIIVWNISKGTTVNIIDCHPDVIYSMSFNRDGSLLATTCKDKMLRILEPRSGQVISAGQCHQGTKSSKVIFLGDSGRLLTTGFSRHSDRQYSVWDQKDLRKPLCTENIDSSSGVLIPYYDYDTKIIFLAGKGDGNIRYYELVDEAPYVHYLDQYLSSSPQRGVGIMPKRGCQVINCEIYCFYKLHATKGLCEPVSMIVPRKSNLFQEDLYPDTAAPTPSLTADEWIHGEDRPPILMSMKTGSLIQTNKPVVYKPSEKLLITADRNNEKKFVFLSQETIADYRPMQSPRYQDKCQKTNLNCGANNFQNWMNLEQKQNNTPCINDLLANSNNLKLHCSLIPTDKKVEIINQTPTKEIEWRKAYDEKCSEIRILKSEIAAKDKRIRRLEEQLWKLDSPQLLTSNN